MTTTSSPTIDAPTARRAEQRARIRRRLAQMKEHLQCIRRAVGHMDRDTLDSLVSWGEETEFDMSLYRMLANQIRANATASADVPVEPLGDAADA